MTVHLDITTGIGAAQLGVPMQGLYHVMIRSNQTHPVELFGLKVCVPPNYNTDNDSPRFLEVI